MPVHDQIRESENHQRGVALARLRRPAVEALPVDALRLLGRHLHPLPAAVHSIRWIRFSNVPGCGMLLVFRGVISHLAPAATHSDTPFQDQPGAWEGGELQK